MTKASTADPPEYLSAGISSRRLPQWLTRPARRLVNRVAGFTRFNSIYAPLVADGVPDDLGGSFLRHIGATVETNPDGLKRIPAAGPLIIVANHPFGMIEGFILNALVWRVRRDFKLLAAYKLKRIPGLAPFLFTVDPIKKRGKRRINLSAWHGIFRWLAGGKVLITFPAGRVSRYRPRFGRVTDGDWNPHIATLVRRTRAPVLPVYFLGRNGFVFQLIGLIYSELQNFLVVWEFNRMRRLRYQLIIGSLIEETEIAAVGSDQELIDLLRERTYGLAAAAETGRFDQVVPAGKSTIP